ncbi:response regulator [Thalassococcus sp. CAU 1522]|uniref:histidine kinase n=1 Tax=Thalassococcus arenae TaxID=2851652 RepID=A0ABS6N9S7_9RHOB|nr:PAS domain-containing sensor histidine kinase [Thalassococcus arenae]MBV2360775.1 response regulator [Thalassococcus arenae]
MPNPTAGLGFWAASGVFAVGFLGLAGQGAAALWRRPGGPNAIADWIEDDPAWCFLTDGDGHLLVANAAARARFDVVPSKPLAQVLGEVFASPEGILHRLGLAASRGRPAVEDVTSHAEGLRVTARMMSPEITLWRLERGMAGAAASGEQAVMTLGRNGAVLYMSARARALVGHRAKRIDEVVRDLPLKPGGVHSFDTVDGTKRFLVQQAETGAGRVELTLFPVSDPESDAASYTDFDRLPVALLKIAPDGRILRANRGAAKLLDIAADAPTAIGDYVEGLGRPIKDWIAEAADGKGLHRSEFLRLTRADREVFIQVTLTRTLEDGAPVLVAVLNDATELKTLEAQFVQSQKMQAIGQLAGGVAHDFNNLLTAISGHCDLMLLRHDQGDPDYGDLMQINQNANRAAALVGQLLAFSRKQTMRPEVLDLRDTMSDLTHLLNRLVGERVTLSLRHDPILPPIRGDRRQLEQVMMNLVVNARDAMSEGGEILIETERQVLREPLTRDRAVVEPGTYVCVKVTDAGVGIPPDKLQKVFEPFFTTKRTGEGTGLGLSTVYGIVKQSGGFIFVDSVLGGGTCFTLLFPAHEARREASVEPEPQARRKLPQKGSGVVLLVEDEAPVRAFAARALRLRGYTVVEAETAEDALALLDDADMLVDVFVTDVVMPGMDGPTWVRKAREKRPDVRVVFVSGYAEDMFGEGQQDIPNSTFLAKPFSLADLTETVHAQFA